MGGGSWDSKAYKAAAAHRAATGTSSFDYSDRYARREVTGVHPDLDPKKVAGATSVVAGLNIRESRDSAEHPESLAGVVIFDDTGSMSQTPKVMQKKLEKLMDILVDKTGLKDFQLLYGAVGDFFSDRLPLQIGHFETDNRSDEHLRKIVLEGGGGGGNHESYQLAFYFGARKTATDCFEKRGKKGYFITIGDEKCYLKLSREEARKIFGDDIQKDLPLETILAELSEKWNHFHIIPADTDYRGSPENKAFWQEYLGERVVAIEKAELICEVIAGLVYMLEGAHTPDKVVGDMGLKGASGDAVKNALVPIAKSNLPSQVVKGTLPKAGKGSGGVTRL